MLGGNDVKNQIPLTQTILAVGALRSDKIAYSSLKLNSRTNINDVN